MYVSYKYIYILGVVKRNPLFLYEIEWKNNGFLFTTSNIYIYIYKHIDISMYMYTLREKKVIW